MLEWDVLEEDEALADQKRPARRAPRRWAAAILLALLALALLWGLVRWQQHQQVEQVRAELNALIAAEARVQAVGEWEQAESFFDPETPLAWRNAYLYHMAHPPTRQGTPELAEIALNETGDRALVTVAWPAAATTTNREQRAYRWVEGSWRRSPVREQEEPLEERTSTHFVLRGEPSLLDELSDPAWRFDPEALYADLAARWPSEWLEPRPITLLVRWQEFGPAVQKTSSRRLLLANAPTLNYQSGGTLSSAAYYRLQLADHLILKILPVQQLDREAYAALQRQLHWAEARWWALDDAERAALRDEWRSTLGDADPWQLATTPLADCDETDCADQWRAMNLLLDTLVLEQGDAVLGRLAHGLAALDADPIAPTTIEQWLRDATSEAPAALRQRLQAFVEEE